MSFEGRPQQNIILFDDDGNPVAVSNKGGIFRLSVDALIDTNGIAADLANRTLVSNQYIVADHVFRYGINTREWSEIEVAGGSIGTIPDQSAAQMSVGTGATDEATLRTHRFYRYQAGKTVSAELTGYISALPSANQVWEMGLRSADDGVFFRLTDSGPEFVIRSSATGSVVENVITQANWNLDKFDGTEGNSPVLDFTTGNIFGFRYKWLGYGRIEFQINETIAHVESNSNIRAEPFVRSATLPLHACLQNDGAATANSASFICAKLDMEGGDIQPAVMNSAGNIAEISVNQTGRPILSIRNKSTFGGVENRQLIVPTLLSSQSDGGSVILSLVLNGTLSGGGGPSWASVGANSSVEFDITANAVSGGTVLQRFYFGQSNNVGSIAIPLDAIFGLKREVLRLDEDGVTPDVLTLFCQKIKGGTTDVLASLTLAEL